MLAVLIFPLRYQDKPFPLHAPSSALATIAIGKDTDMPHMMLHIIVKVKPVKIAGLRPNASEALPHMIAVMHWDNENTADVIPAHLATSLFSTPKPSIISGCKMLFA